MYSYLFLALTMCTITTSAMDQEQCDILNSLKDPADIIAFCQANIANPEERRLTIMQYIPTVAQFNIVNHLAEIRSRQEPVCKKVKR